MQTKKFLNAQSYNDALLDSDRRICTLLCELINAGLPGSQSKIWHRNPVWFLNGNPIVGYAKLKNNVQLLFWSGQSFDEGGLEKEGSFKAAQARYTSLDQVNRHDLTRWLQKAQDIQWDYKNIVKNRGVLKRVV